MVSPLPNDDRGFYSLIVYWYLKTFSIMANFDIIFKCTSGDGCCIETFLNSNNEISILIYYEQNEDDQNLIFLDKSTAIKFAKTLRTEINKIQD